MDIIAGLDAAVKDSIDVLSFSIGAYSGMQFNYDPIAMAAFKAMESGIFVSCAAGNAGRTSSEAKQSPTELTVSQRHWTLLCANGSNLRAHLTFTGHFFAP